MKIDELPIEMLMTIFRHLRALENVSLVNWKFYDAACKVSDPRICLKLTPPYPVVDAEDTLKYIRKTTRKIANLVIEMGRATPKACVPIAGEIGKFSPNIKKLTIRGGFRFSDILDILSMAPNAEFIEIEQVVIYKDHDGSPNITNEDLNLANLKTLKIVRCAGVVILNRLPVNVLTELVLPEVDLVELNDLFKRQGTIKTLTISEWNSSHHQGPPVLPVDYFDNQKLEALRCTLRTFNNSNFALILSKQKNLKRLEVESSYFGDGFMNAVTNDLTGLETLTMYSYSTGWTILRNIKKLKKLKYLQLQLGPHPEWVAHLQEFATSVHSSITTLRIRLRDISRHVLVAVAKSVPNLKVLDFDYRGFENDVATLNMIMEIFNFVERLSFTLDDSSFIQGNLSQRNSANPKLIDLNIGWSLRLDTKSLETLIECYPNLKRLSVGFNELSVPTFKSILNDFKKLESLSLEVSNQMPAFDASALLDCLRMDGKKLKFVEISCWQGWNINAEIKSELSAIYEVVEVDHSVLRLGVDKKVMEERESESTYSRDVLTIVEWNSFSKIQI